MAQQANGGEIRARLTLENRQFRQRMDESRDRMRGMNDEARRTRRGVEALSGAFKAAGLGVTAIAAASVATAAQFEQSMARVQAVSGANEEQFQALEQAALEAGSTTQFTANQSADALSYLAMAGFEAQESVAALPNVLNLASAAQTDLASSADIVSNIMTGFGMSAEDTAHATDVLVKSMTTANTDLPQLGQAMKYAAPVAEGLGMSIEESAAAIAKMSDAGIQGSQAGTALRASLLSLANPTGQAEKAIEELGIKVKDSEGNMKELPDLIGHINGKLDGMTDAQKTAYAAQLVGTEASAGFISVLNEGEEGLRDYIKQLENSKGTAEEVAEVQKDTLSGSFKEFVSALEGAGIGIGQEFIPELRALVEMGTDAARAIGEMNPKIIEMGLKMAGGAAAAGTLVTAIKGISVAWKAMRISMGPIGWLSLGLGAVAGALFDVNEETEKAEEVNLDHADSLAKQQKSLDEMIDQYDDLREKSKLSTDEFGRFIDIQKILQTETDPKKIEALKNEQADLQEKSGLTNKELKDMVGLNNDIIDSAPQAAEAVSGQGTSLVGLGDAAKEYNEALREKLRLELEDQRNNAMSNLEQNIKDANEALKKQKELAHDIRDNAEDINNAKQLQSTKQMVVNQLEKDGIPESDKRMQNAKDELEAQKDKVGSLQDERVELQGKLNEQESTLNKARLEVMEGERAVDKLVQFYLKQVDVNAKKGEEVTKIKEAIKETDKHIAKLETKKQKSGSLTAEEQDQLQSLKDQSYQLDVAKGKIQELQGEQNELTAFVDDTKGQTIDLNAVMDEDINKWLTVEGYNENDARSLNEKIAAHVRKDITVDDNGTADDVNYEAGRPISKTVHLNPIMPQVGILDRLRHNGGPAGKPKYHTGGNVEEEPSQQMDFRGTLSLPPKHNEVDARLLQDEMVLTTQQQDNLFRLINTFGNIQAQRLEDSHKSSGSAGPTQIHVESMTIREEADINRVAEELDRLDKYKRRSRGGR